MNLDKREFDVSLSVAVLLLLSPFCASPIWAHPGGLDANGGHVDRKTGEYHKHIKKKKPAIDPFVKEPPVTKKHTPPPTKPKPKSKTQDIPKSSPVPPHPQVKPKKPQISLESKLNTLLLRLKQRETDLGLVDTQSTEAVSAKASPTTTSKGYQSPLARLKAMEDRLKALEEKHVEVLKKAHQIELTFDNLEVHLLEQVDAQLKGKVKLLEETVETKKLQTLQLETELRKLRHEHFKLKVEKSKTAAAQAKTHESAGQKVSTAKPAPQKDNAKVGAPAKAVDPFVKSKTPDAKNKKGKKSDKEVSEEEAEAVLEAVKSLLPVGAD